MSDDCFRPYRSQGKSFTFAQCNSFYFQTEKRNRRARHLHTSARYLEAFREKAELIDIDKEQFEQV